jgi:hypothetical protein
VRPRRDCAPSVDGALAPGDVIVLVAEHDGASSVRAYRLEEDRRKRSFSIEPLKLLNERRQRALNAAFALGCEALRYEQRELMEGVRLVGATEAVVDDRLAIGHTSG